MAQVNHFARCDEKKRYLFLLLLGSMVGCGAAIMDGGTLQAELDELRSESGTQLILYGVPFDVMTRRPWGIEEARSSYKFKTLVCGSEISYRDSLALIEAVGSVRSRCPKSESYDMRLVCEVFQAGQLVEVFGFDFPRGHVWIDGKWFEPADAALFDKVEKYLPWYVVRRYQKTSAEEGTGAEHPL